MADRGPHSRECETADSADCFCSCRGTHHGVGAGGKARSISAVTKVEGGHYRVPRAAATGRDAVVAGAEVRKSGAPERGPGIGSDIRGRHDWSQIQANLPDQYNFETGTTQGSNDPLVDAIAARQGFDGPAEVGTAADVDAAVAAGGVELWRAVTSDEAAKQMTTGRYYASTGTQGSGIYTTTNTERADHFTRGLPKASVMHMALRPGAVVANVDDLEEEMDAAKARGDLAVGGPLDDPGRWAAAKGIDAYWKLSANGHRDWIIMNRTALIVQAP
jgi:hypothetical protein